MKNKQTIDFRRLINKAIVRTGKTIPNIAKEAGINRATLYNFCAGRTDMNGTNLEKVMNVLSMRIRIPKEE